MAGVVLKGVDTTYDWSFFRQSLVEGDLPRTGGGVRHKDVLLSRTLADQMEVGAGDPVEMLFIQNPPRRDRFRVCGIYDTGFGEMDRTMVFTDMAGIRRR